MTFSEIELSDRELVLLEFVLERVLEWRAGDERPDHGLKRLKQAMDDDGGMSQELRELMAGFYRKKMGLK